MSQPSIPTKKLLAIALLATLVFLGAVTQINLATQVFGLLAIANGGTGTSSPSLVSGTGITVSGSWPNQTITNTGQTTALNFADAEIPSGLINGANTTYTLAHTPSPAASLDCYENGVEQRAGGADYTLATATITYGVAPPTGTTLVCFYRY